MVKSMMRLFPSLAPVSFLAMLASIAGAALHAQTVPAVSSTSAKETEEKVVVLSPFEVNATGDKGYLATSAMSGTRLNSKIEDIAASLSVVTKQ